MPASPPRLSSLRAGQRLRALHSSDCYSSGDVFTIKEDPSDGELFITCKHGNHALGSETADFFAHGAIDGDLADDDSLPGFELVLGTPKGRGKG